MKKIFSLLKVLFKTNINSANDQKKKNKVLLLLGLAVYILFIFSNFWQMFITPLQEIGQANMSIYLILSISSGFILVTSITYIVNILYFTNDMENIIPFPFKPRELFAAKLMIVYLYEMMITTMFALPGLIAYGIKLQAGIVYYCYAFIVYLFLPVIPVIGLTIIYTLVMQFVKFGKYKNVFRIISTVIILGFIVWFQMQLNANMLANGDYDGNYILEMCHGYQEHMPYYLSVAINAIHGNQHVGGLLAIGWYILINVALLVTTIFAFDKLYLRGVRHNFDVPVSMNGKGKVRYQKTNPFHALVKKELKALFRNITFFMQCVLPTSIMPAIIMVSILSSGEATGMDISSHPVVKMLFGFLIIQFFMMMNQISATAISRDGEQEASFVKSFPISTTRIIQAKAMPSIYVGLFNLVIAMIFNCITFDFQMIEILELIVGGILLNGIQSYLFLIIDLKKPKLRWESEISVVKHSMNVLKAILLWFGIMIITALLGNVFLILNGNYFGVLFVVLLGLGFLSLNMYVKKNAEKYYDKIF